MYEKKEYYEPLIPQKPNNGGDKEAIGYTDYELSMESHLEWGGFHRKCGYQLYTGGYGFHFYCWYCHKLVDNNEIVHPGNKQEVGDWLEERETILSLYW